MDVAALSADTYDLTSTLEQIRILVDPIDESALDTTLATARTTLLNEQKTFHEDEIDRINTELNR